jgi:hypothetical protein
MWKSIGRSPMRQPAEVGDERLAQAVQQRPAEQDRDAAGARERVDLREVRLQHVARVEKQLALAGAGDRDAVGVEHRVTT